MVKKSSKATTARLTSYCYSGPTSPVEIGGACITLSPSKSIDLPANDPAVIRLVGLKLLTPNEDKTHA